MEFVKLVTCILSVREKTVVMDWKTFVFTLKLLGSKAYPKSFLLRCSDWEPNDQINYDIQVSTNSDLWNSQGCRTFIYQVFGFRSVMDSWNYIKYLRIVL